MSTRPCSLMTAYAEGSIVGRELQELLASEAARARFDRELRTLDAQAGAFVNGDADISDWMHNELVAGGSL